MQQASLGQTASIVPPARTEAVHFPLLHQRAFSTALGVSCTVGWRRQVTVVPWNVAVTQSVYAFFVQEGLHGSVKLVSRRNP